MLAAAADASPLPARIPQCSLALAYLLYWIVCIGFASVFCGGIAPLTLVVEVADEIVDCPQDDELLRMRCCSGSSP